MLRILHWQVIQPGRQKIALMPSTQILSPSQSYPVHNEVLESENLDLHLLKMNLSKNKPFEFIHVKSYLARVIGNIKLFYLI